MRTIPSTDGVHLAVHDLGGSGSPVLLAHATGFHGLVWAPLARHLTAAGGLHAWAPDLRGHGDATVPEDRRFAWDGFADDVVAVVDDLDLERPFGVGHSKGGAALVLAEQRRPGTFGGLYLYEPVIFPTDHAMVTGQGENPLAAGAERRRATFDSHEAAIANFAAKAPFDALDPEALRAYVEGGLAPQPDGTVTLKCRPEHEAEVYRMAATSGAFDALGDLRCPVVVARGRLGEGGPAQVAEAVADALPHGRVEVFDHLGHFGPLEEPATVAAAIAAAVARDAPPDG